MTKMGGKMIKTWNKRYFQLIGNELIYYKQPGTPSTGKIPINQVQYVALDPKCKKQPAFQMCIPNKRTYVMITESVAEANSWVEVIERYRTTTFEDLQVTGIEDFEIERKITESENCTILLVHRKSNYNDKFVVKQFDQSKYGNLDLPAMIEKCQSFLTTKHPFVTSLRYFFEDEKLSMVYEYIDTGLLFGHLYDEGKFSESRTAFYLAELILGLNYIHQHQVVYGRLSPKSILLTEEGHIKLTDPSLQLPSIVVDEYTSPDIIKGEITSISSDYYCLGILAYEMLCGMPPLYSKNTEELQLMILDDPIRFPRHVSKNAKQLVRRLLSKSAELRLHSFEEFKAHPFFEKINWEEIFTKSVLPEWVPNPENDKIYEIFEDCQTN